MNVYRPIWSRPRAQEPPLDSDRKSGRWWRHWQDRIDDASKEQRELDENGDYVLAPISTDDGDLPF